MHTLVSEGTDVTASLPQRFVYLLGGAQTLQGDEPPPYILFEVSLGASGVQWSVENLPLAHSALPSQGRFSGLDVVSVLGNEFILTNWALVLDFSRGIAYMLCLEDKKGQDEIVGMDQEAVLKKLLILVQRMYQEPIMQAIAQALASNSSA